ncbi:hypothetical protein BD780_004299 [Clostridium tetanomorphum]|uniref:DUF3343 domain-containing protein n=1 Tax=Clostridium tetanomorphum TaxID=1553 RepID=A0A923E865_CLOTT|nr:DUF3343 domain-containing protein [Clostridium tetanomorphum]KAJ52017.1 hypothetical protein CTM_09601 [Clostridium tetanomorphum DSM 665]MBC2397027.1 DUF3343 domain-containing protein [Clostridium tetanomorphum]MBP1862937.1 hypothetical protein [Clostridium tetanomorphum]NRS87074.1 hypothetical protein [Clostridium tetanomorphum]NRZ99131.1 hypothetical protein [Clostridium tetanomorphum]
MAYYNNDNKEYIVVFQSYNGAIYLYNKLLRERCKAEIISTPCRISAGCTQSIKFKCEYMDIVQKNLKLYNIPIKGIYEIVKSNKRFNYVKIM